MKRLINYFVPDLYKKYFQLFKIFNELGYKQSYKKKRSVNKNSQPIPWFTYPAFQFIHQLDLREKTVFEWGSGYSSLYFAKKVKNITSIENNKEWYLRIKKLQYTNMNLLFTNEDNYVQSITKEKEKFDIIIIDGKFREECIKLAPNHLKNDGIIIVDNSDWYSNSLNILRVKGYIQVDFHGFGPLNHYTWTTSIFLSREYNFNSLNLRQPSTAVGGIVHKNR